MASGAWTYDDLLTAVKAEYVNPVGSDITDAQLLTIAREELFSLVMPLITDTRGGYFETIYDVVSTGSREYTIPPRAIGNRIVNLAALDPQGNEYLVPLTDYSDPRSQAINTNTTPNPVAYIRNNKLVLNPALTTGYTIRMIIYLRPGDPILTTDAATVVSKTSTSITMSSTPAGLSTGVAFDVVSNNPPFPYWSYDKTGTVAANVITGITVPDDVAVGDYVCLAGRSPIPQIPYELHPVLMELVASRVVGRLGDQKQKAILGASAQEKYMKAIENLKPRIVNQPMRIVNNESPVGNFSGWNAPYRWY